MKKSHTNSNANYSCLISNTSIYTSENNDLIYIKSYRGDWGDWDEKPANIAKIDSKQFEHTAKTVSTEKAAPNF
ncbi:hypothetical protein [Flavobacterium reichenbachii]|uniref:Uncharacterized protein n=1 Tax=Flavobacterium reichenbachii TaxID=362418 RepID=A0A085ZKU7_9FLAO|nr:hypothetical protein [Flavobacterium reichenbachii]KFF05061.1 hypothetical protein IW19_05750 [Flavobacterium reichenbachii]OXB16267.1 hypothetical protein B0A68_08400 [Flavobacterium reichenbachii]